MKKEEEKVNNLTTVFSSLVNSTTFNTDSVADSSVFIRESFANSINTADNSLTCESNTSSTVSSNDATRIEATIYDGESTVLNTCCCGKITFIDDENRLCKDCTLTDTDKGISETFLSSDQSLFLYDNSYIENNETDLSSLCVCFPPIKTDICTQVDNNLSLCVNSRKHEVSIQCELGHGPNVTQLDEYSKRNFQVEETKESNHPMTKTTTDYLLKKIDKNFVEEIDELSLEKSDFSSEYIYERYSITEGCPEICEKCNTEKYHYLGILGCMCTSDSLLNDINHSINQVPESTILTDSDDSNNYSDQETGIDMNMIKRFKPVGGESNEVIKKTFTYYLNFFNSV